MTVGELLAYVREVRPNTFSDAVLIGLINTVEGRIQTELLAVRSEQALRYEAADTEAELLVQQPYDDVYRWYVMSMVEYLLGEFSQYDMDRQMFESAWNSLATYICKAVRPAYGGRWSAPRVLTLVRGASASIIFQRMPLEDGDVGSLTVTFRQGGVAVLKLTEADGELRYEDGALTVLLSPDETELLYEGVAAVSWAASSRDGEAVYRSWPATRLMIRESEA